MVLDPVVLLISIAGVVLSFLVTPLINKKNYELFQKLIPSNRKMDYVKRIFYINLYTKELKLFNFKDLFLSMYSDANQDVLNIRKKYSKSVLSMVILQNIIGSLTFVLTLVYLGFRMINHGMDAGTCFALVNGSINIKMQLSGFLIPWANSPRTAIILIIIAAFSNIDPSSKRIKDLQPPRLKMKIG